ncbi:MAG: polymer-forming cytoskeletal protein [Cellvibrionales bacterium]|nr:polymer-forming cytoskeletal protein [Cellvibrionales bacterium]
MFKKESKIKSEEKSLPTSFSNPVSQAVGKSSAPKGGSLTTLIAQDTQITGDIKFSGLLEVEGTILGNVSASDSGDAHIRIQESGRVEGDIHVQRVVINGNVTGKVYSETLELAAKAHVEGNVHYSTIEMMKGAQVNGNLVHEENAIKKIVPQNQEIKPAKPEKEAVAVN